MNISKRIRVLRAVKGWTGAELGVAAGGVNAAMISRVESGESVTVTNLEKIAKGLNMTLSEITAEEIIIKI